MCEKSYKFEGRWVRIVREELHPASIGSDLYGPEFVRLDTGALIRKGYFLNKIEGVSLCEKTEVSRETEHPEIKSKNGVESF